MFILNGHKVHTSMALYQIIQQSLTFLQTNEYIRITKGRTMVKMRTKVETTNPVIISPLRARCQLGLHASEKERIAITNTMKTCHYLEAINLTNRYANIEFTKEIHKQSRSTL